jgi:phosphoketolase
LPRERQSPFGDGSRINPDNIRIFSPDETISNRWNAVFEVTNRCSIAQILAGDDHVAPDGRVMEMLRNPSARAGWKAGLHQAQDPLLARNEWGEDRGEGKSV